MCPGLFTVALSVIIKEWKQPKSTTTVGKWLRKLLYIVTMEYCAIVRKMKKISIYRLGVTPRYIVK